MAAIEFERTVAIEALEANQDRRSQGGELLFRPLDLEYPGWKVRGSKR